MEVMSKKAAIEKMMNENSHISIVDLNKSTGLSRTVFYAWKKGVFKKPENESVYKLAEATGTNIEIIGDQVTFTGDKKIKGVAKDMEMEYVMGLQRDKITYLEEKILSLQKINESKEVTKTIITTSLWDSIDYDVQTFQTYDKRDFGYFKSYKIIRWQEFFAKLGYHGEEAEIMYQKHLDSMDYNLRKTDRANDDNFLLYREVTDEALYDRDATNQFFRDEKSAQTVSKMTRFNLNYKHKNGGYIPAILHSLFDFDKLTGISKIKFVDGQN